MRNFAILAFFALVTMYFFASGNSGSENSTEASGASDAVGVGAAETFTWQGEQPITFKPPLGWRSGRYQQGGRNGVDYIQSGQRIAVTEYTKVGQLDGCAKLQEVLSELGTSDNRALQRKLRNAVRSPQSVTSAKEASMLRGIKEYVAEAEEALANNDIPRVRQEIDNAMRTRFANEFHLDDYLDDVIYSQTAQGDLKRVEIEIPEQLMVGGEQAVSIDYEVDIEANYATGLMKKTEAGRQVYVISNNRLFIASFQGRPENMSLFELVVNSIAFPDGLCSL